ncbi:MAG: hypothetical protein KatS3mg115_1779 [Candidatus Poribacteria bacterium]|nr:MAG: hypothetical protein KatS3mg115_1779 [Candidatus Poribacteria bacterium]
MLKMLYAGARLRAVVGVIVFLAPCAIGRAVPGAPSEAIVELMNRGVGLVEQHRFSEAAEVFRQVVERAPNWAVAHLNLGIAYLNTVADPSAGGDALELARQEFLRAAELDPSLPHPHYCLGLLARYRGESEEAVRHFREVLRRDPDSADALYFLGAIALQKGEAQTARDYFQQALQQNPYLLSAHYSLAQALIRLGEREAAMERLELFRRLDAAGVGVKRAIVYTEMGPYAEVIRVFPPAPDAPAEEDFPLAWERQDYPITGLNGSEFRPAEGVVAGADLDGDDVLELAVPLARGEERWALGLLRRTPEGFSLFETLPTGEIPPQSALFGDWDNDGTPDLALFGRGLLRLYRQEGGRLKEVTGPAGLQAPILPWVAAAWVDADHDSDLDLIVLWEGALQLWQNRGDGTFAEIAGDSGLLKPYSEMNDLVLADFDGDLDVDLLLLTGVGRPYLFFNERMNRWSDGSARSGLPEAIGAVQALSGDFDRDEDTDLFLRYRDGALRYCENKGDGTFRVHLWEGQISSGGGLVLDADNDSDLDVLWTAPLQLLRNDGRGRFRLESGRQESSARLFALDLDGDGDTDLIGAGRSGLSGFLTIGPEPNRWLRLALRGTMANRSGYGATVEVKAGSLWQRLEQFMIANRYGAASPEIALGLDGKDHADYVRIVWPNAVIQSELLLPANQRVEIEEVQRKASSCPVLFAWDGERYRFITDFLGVGGVGFFVAPGRYGQPDPTERIKLEPGEVRPKDGFLLFSVAEPMEEVAYLDEVTLLAVDHPEGTSLYPEERFALNGELPSERIYLYQTPIYPRRAVDGQGRDVLEALLRRDRLYPPLERHPRYLGFLDGEASWVLDFSGVDQAWSPDRRKVLFLYGWIEYPYSHLVYAAYQEGLQGRGLHVDVLDASGAWREVIQDAGYPAGMPKMMTLDLTEWFDPERPIFRLRTNLEIYLDEVFLAEDLGEGLQRVHRLSADRAELGYLGYPREYSPDGRLPRLYDYHSVERSVPFKIQRGRYTRFGDVRELLKAADDRYVIFGRGEEVRLAFSVDRLPPVPEGWTRSYLLHTDGFCKDMDFYTAYPWTVEPLPFHGMSAYPYPEGERYPDTPAIREYLRTYQTRWK